MSSYNIFARYYDLLTQNVDYPSMCNYILNLADKNGVKGGRALDLACGTGSLTYLLSESGFDAVGLDMSEEMLCQADSRFEGSLKLLKGDMTNFSFSEKFNLCVCSLDSINHLPDINSVAECFKCVYNALSDGGVFIFDVNTIYKHREILADNTFVFDEEDFFLSWDNELIDDNTVRILLDFFVFNGKNYDRYSEEFFERAYTVDEISAVLDGFETVGIYDELTENPPTDTSQRIYFVCKRK